MAGGAADDKLVCPASTVSAGELRAGTLVDCKRYLSCRIEFHTGKKGIRLYYRMLSFQNLTFNYLLISA